jgi:hypothetical protein
MKLYTAFRAVALAFGLCQVTAADGPAAALQDARSPDRVTASDGGLSTLWIVLICLGGVAALAAAGLHDDARGARSRSPLGLTDDSPDKSGRGGRRDALPCAHGQGAAGRRLLATPPTDTSASDRRAVDGKGAPCRRTRSICGLARRPPVHPCRSQGM